MHEQNFEAYGYPRVWHELRRQGEQVGRDRVARLMRWAGIGGAKRRGKPWRTTIPDLTAQKRPDLVNRDFSATEPDRLWVGDFTYLRTWEGRVFFAFLIDVFSRMIVGWQLATHMRTDARARRAADGAGDAPARRGRSSWWPIPTRARNTPARTTRRNWMTPKVLASVGSVGDCIRQRARRIIRGHLQDRADRRPRLAHQSAARARDRRLRRLVQPPPAAHLDREPTADRARTRVLGSGSRSGSKRSRLRPPQQRPICETS